MKRSLIVMSTVLMAVLAIALGMMALRPTSQAAAQTETTAPPRTITVSGHGRVTVQPDTAIVRFGVQTEAETAAEALETNSTQMTDVISATTNAGIANEDIQTQGLSLQPVYESSDSTTGTPPLSGYRASNIVQVTVRDISGLGELLDAAVAAGGNTIEGIQFVVSDQTELEAAAREAAINDAQQKAEQLVGLTNVELGEVQAITETGISSPAPIAFAVQDSAGGGVPVQPGTQMIETWIQVTWAIQ